MGSFVRFLRFVKTFGSYLFRSNLKPIVLLVCYTPVRRCFSCAARSLFDHTRNNLLCIIVIPSITRICADPLCGYYSVPKLLSKNCCKHTSPYCHRHVGSTLNLINATQSAIPVDKYGMIGPYSLFWE